MLPPANSQPGERVTFEGYPSPPDLPKVNEKVGQLLCYAATPLTLL